MRDTISSILAAAMILSAPGLPCYQAAAQYNRPAGGARLGGTVDMPALNAGRGVNSTDGLNIQPVALQGDFNPVLSPEAIFGLNERLAMQAAAQQARVSAAPVPTEQVVEAPAEASGGTLAQVQAKAEELAAPKADAAPILADFYDNAVRTGGRGDVVVSRASASPRRSSLAFRAKTAAATAAALLVTSRLMAFDGGWGAPQTRAAGGSYWEVWLPWAIGLALGIGWWLRERHLDAKFWRVTQRLQDELAKTKRTLAQREFEAQARTLPGFQSVYFPSENGSYSTADVVFGNQRDLEKLFVSGRLVYYGNNKFGSYYLGTGSDNKRDERFGFVVRPRLREASTEQEAAFRQYVRETFPPAADLEISGGDATITFVSQDALQSALATGELAPMVHETGLYLTKQEFPYRIHLSVQRPQWPRGH